MAMKSDGLLGSALVALQLGLMAVVAWLAAPSFVRAPLPLAPWALLLGAAALGGWALSANRPGNFNILPTPRPGGQLVQSGPYRWIRHPMYSAVLLVAAACAWVDASAWAWVAMAALVAVLTVKAGLEERWMAEKHSGYADYCGRSNRFVPGIF
jgi:protein-S-isoprenylcysteine O-methyltransferase Ste14